MFADDQIAFIEEGARVMIGGLHFQHICDIVYSCIGREHESKVVAVLLWTSGASRSAFQICAKVHFRDRVAAILDLEVLLVLSD